MNSVYYHTGKVSIHRSYHKPKQVKTKKKKSWQTKAMNKNNIGKILKTSMSSPSKNFKYSDYEKPSEGIHSLSYHDIF